MSLRLLLPEAGVTELMLTWPDEPRVFERGKSALDQKASAEVLRGHVLSGCYPADEIAVVKAPHPSLSEKAYTTDGRTDRAKLSRLYGDGHTIRLGNLQRVVPFLAEVSQGIQQETGFSNYVHAFLTPPGHQGLRHHWDQQMAVIVQITGAKRWQLWKPPVESPMRDYAESWRVWREDYIPTWEKAGPDVELDLKAGQSLLLPRGWVHNPHALDADEQSMHLTFAIRERTPLWLAEKLLSGAIENPDFRRIIRPGQLGGVELGRHLAETRDALIEHLRCLDIPEVAVGVHRAALTELEYTT